MRDISSLEDFLGQNRGSEQNSPEHFQWNNKQGGMKSFRWTLYAEWVSPTANNAASGEYLVRPLLSHRRTG
jgi:hypothetical protein